MPKQRIKFNDRVFIYKDMPILDDETTSKNPSTHGLLCYRCLGSDYTRYHMPEEIIHDDMEFDIIIAQPEEKYKDYTQLIEFTIECDVEWYSDERKVLNTIFDVAFARLWFHISGRDIRIELPAEYVKLRMEII